MTAAVQTSTTFDVLDACMKHLGVAIIAIWGVDEKGFCQCPQGTQCKSPGKHPNGKLCPRGVKDATRDAAIVRQWIKMQPRGNWAFRCGEPLPDGGFLGILDVDPRNGGDATLVEITDRYGALRETVTQSTGSNGLHFAFRFPHAPAARLVGPGLDLQGGGKYIVIAPSKHAKGGVYQWDLGLGPGEHAVADAPDWLVNGTGEAQPRPAPDDGTARETVLGEAFALAGRAGPIMTDGMMMVNCPQSHMHSDDRGKGQDPSCVILPPAGGSRFGGFRCQHGHCANLKWPDVLRMLPKEHVDAANRKYPKLGVAKPEAPAPAANESKPASPAPAAPRAPSGLSDDERDGSVIRNALAPMMKFKEVKGAARIAPDEINLAVILTFDPRWKGLLTYDEFSQCLRFTRQPEWHPDDAPMDKSMVWGDHHVHPLNLWLRRNWGLELTTEKIREGVYTVARRNGRNPLTTYLDSLTWDKTQRIDEWLVRYLGVEDTPYARSVGRKWLISAVARAYKPGTKVDTLLVLEGPQGKGKSTALRMLVPEPTWFSDTPIDIGNKDAFVAIRGKWIYELAELASLKKTELDKMKAFFSAPADSYRPPYGREQITVPRTCIFAGTVNLGEYLHDSTGARRFWPVKVGAIDIGALIADRDHLWAEAVAIFRSWVERGAPQSECLWWPAPEELPLFEKEQSEREVTHPWVDRVATWLKTGKAKDLAKTKGYLLTSDIASIALDIPDKDLDQSKATQIGIIMQREMKWTKRRFSLNGARVWGYVPPAGT